MTACLSLVGFLPARAGVTVSIDNRVTPPDFQTSGFDPSFSSTSYPSNFEVSFSGQWQSTDPNLPIPGTSFGFNFVLTGDPSGGKGVPKDTLQLIFTILTPNSSDPNNIQLDLDFLSGQNGKGAKFPKGADFITNTGSFVDIVAVDPNPTTLPIGGTYTWPSDFDLRIASNTGIPAPEPATFALALIGVGVATPAGRNRIRV
jgi:hypothetical protein